jgi:hypothetical protein
LIQDPRTYYEVFGDTVVLLNTFKLVSVLLSAVIFFQVYVNLRAQQKEPLVIRVDELGKAEAISDLSLESEPDEIQVQAFVREFVERFTSYDSKSVEYDFAKALNLMHSHYQKRAREELLTTNLLGELKEGELYSRVNLQEIRIEKNVPGYIHVWVAGLRRVRSYLRSDFSKETFFNAYLTLAKVPRTVKEPYGLLVYDYREHIVKNMIPEEEIKHD